jgi:putative solute:sodium symporter small subunit
MIPDEPQQPSDNFRVNFFRPRSGYMRRKVHTIWGLLAAWVILTFGFQGLLVLTMDDMSGDGPLTRLTFFQIPFHYWFTGQFLILCFIFLCYIFNLRVDQLTRAHQKRK